MPLHPQIQLLVDGMAADPNSTPIHEMTVAEARATYVAIGTMFGPGPEVRSVEDRTLPGPGGEIPVRVYAPEGDGPFGVLLFFHGGGFVIGDLETHDKECRMLCRDGGCLVVAVDYRLAPEHHRTAGAEDGFAVLTWLREHATELGGDPERLAVAGDSAGGNISAVVALMARDTGGPALRLQVLIYPKVDARLDGRYASMKENAEAPFLSRETMEWFEASWATESVDRCDPMLSPLLADSHARLPPALIATGECDPLRDEGRAYAKALLDAGVPTELHDYDGMPHVFFQLSPIVDAGKDVIAKAAAALRTALG